MSAVKIGQGFISFLTSAQSMCVWETRTSMSECGLKKLFLQKIRHDACAMSIVCIFLRAHKHLSCKKSCFLLCQAGHMVIEAVIETLHRGSDRSNPLRTARRCGPKSVAVCAVEEPGQNLH